MCLFFSICFFFFKQKTAYEMRISDWSSDVCSSDLISHSPAQNDAKRSIEDHVVCMATSHRRARLLDQLQQIPIADQDARQIGEGIPFDRKKAEIDRYRIQTQIFEMQIGRSGRQECFYQGSSPKDFRLHRGCVQQDQGGRMKMGSLPKLEVAVC